MPCVRGPVVVNGCEVAVYRVERGDGAVLRSRVDVWAARPGGGIRLVDTIGVQEECPAEEADAERRCDALFTEATEHASHARVPFTA